MHGLNLSVADLLGRPGEYRDFTISSQLPGIGNVLARLAETPVHGDLRAESVVEGILVTGRASATARFECARCLADFTAPVALEVCELFVTPDREQEAGHEDAYKIAGKEIHLEPMLRDALALALPLNPICRDECQGMCSGCGRNLNEAACTCTHDEVDPRWAELAEVRERLQS